LSKLEYIGGLTPYDELPEEIFHYILSFLQDFCRSYKFTGFFGIDFIYNPLTASLEDTAGNIYLIEINPRVTTPYIAYSELFRKLSENLAGLFFDGNYIQKRNYFGGTCEFKKNQKTGLMDITFK
jgi:predicted ATP-grasp superfamily ATP-dependent carboligase